MGALILDWLLGEPDILWRRVPHPVVMFGRAISALEAIGNRRSRTGHMRRNFGILAIIILVFGAGGIGALLSAITSQWIGISNAITLIMLTILLAGRSLDDHIRNVARDLETDLMDARASVGMIVGRNTAEMDQGDIARAAIETGAENLSDGVIAPAFWFLIFGLPGVMIYKMVNTADSMIGYKNARYLAFGWAAARLDDVLNYLPARLTALLICAGSLGGAFRAFSIMRADARSHQSPNAGWPEAAMAGGINVWLAGPRRYGQRIRDAARMNADGSNADSKKVFAAMRVLILAQGLFGILLFVLAVYLTRT